MGGGGQAISFHNSWKSRMSQLLNESSELTLDDNTTDIKQTHAAATA